MQVTLLTLCVLVYAPEACVCVRGTQLVLRLTYNVGYGGTPSFYSELGSPAPSREVAPTLDADVPRHFDTTWIAV